MSRYDTLTACLDCGDPSEHTRCDQCQPLHARQEQQRLGDRHAANPRQRGYDKRWERLSLRARSIQPFCLDCGTTDDLTADHSPEAWRRHYAGKPIRLRDIAVVCRTCNVHRGDQRPT